MTLASTSDESLLKSQLDSVPQASTAQSSFRKSPQRAHTSPARSRSTSGTDHTLRRKVASLRRRYT